MDKNNDAGLERIRHLEERLARAPVNSSRHRLLAKAIQIEAELYRKALDIAQASEQFDAKHGGLGTGHRSQLSVPVKSRDIQ